MRLPSNVPSIVWQSVVTRRHRPETHPSILWNTWYIEWLHEEDPFCGRSMCVSCNGLLSCVQIYLETRISICILYNLLTLMGHGSCTFGRKQSKNLPIFRASAIMPSTCWRNILSSANCYRKISILHIQYYTRALQHSCSLKENIFNSFMTRFYSFE